MTLFAVVRGIFSLLKNQKVHTCGFPLGKYFATEFNTYDLLHAPHLMPSTDC